MRFVDDLYALYKDQLTGDDEDAVIIVSGVLQELSRAELLALVNELDREELFQMLGRYLIDRLREKMNREGFGTSPSPAYDGEVH
ncbi:MAG: hypothetical protein IRY98_11385 [Alicyclobacillaceae bacterium]|nr:hypothetical protein [Alicyclobacillaceae bacterium]